MGGHRDEVPGRFVCKVQESPKGARLMRGLKTEADAIYFVRLMARGMA